VDVNALRERWPDVLDAVRGERRLAWIQLRSAVVQSLEGGVLTLGFSSEGVAKGFATSGCDQVLAGVLSSLLGLNARIKAAVASQLAGGSPGQAGQPPAGGNPRPAASPDPTAAVGPVRSRPAAAQAAGGAAGAARTEARSGARQSHPGRDASAPGTATSTRGEPGGSAGTGSAGRGYPGGSPAEPSIDDADAQNLSGMELIQRQLGGRVIEEIEDA
jgi:DNA polymerase-3 subunit gamma/tau